MADRWGKPTSVSSMLATAAATEHDIKNKKSNGIAPSLFHKKRSKNNKDPSHAEKQLHDLLRLAAKNEVVQKRKVYSSTQNNRRDAYTAVTTLKTFPLQDLALCCVDELTREYLGTDQDDMLHIEHRTSSSCKKLKMCSFTEEFLNEHNYRPDEKTVHKFLPALWSMEPRVFAEETSASGKRKYIVGHLGRFMQQYWRDRDPRSRHCYEMIREGTNCRLYFDLEFCKVSNPQILPNESEELMNEFIAELCIEFQEVYDIKIDRSNIVDLDSTTDKKFSRHLIIHLPKQQLFADAHAAGIFAKTLVGRLAHELSIGTLANKRPILAKHLFVKQKPCDPPNKMGDTSKRDTCFVDLGVYTRNRLFRILGSTKFGKPSSAALRIAVANEFPFPEGFDNTKFYHIEKKVNVKNADERDIEAFSKSLSWDAHAEALAATLVVPANASKMKRIILDVPTQENDSNVEVTTSRRTTSSTRHASIRTSSGPSPMPKLENYFLATLGQRGGTQGKIRAWSIDCIACRDGRPNTYFLTYQMCENRWCENIQRSHKSNNIMWTLDLSNSMCWQGCHDPDCRQAGFRGQSLQLNLTEDVKTEVEDFLLEQEMICLDEKKVLNKNAASESDVQFGDAEFDKELCKIRYG